MAKYKLKTEINQVKEPPSGGLNFLFEIFIVEGGNLVPEKWG